MVLVRQQFEHYLISHILISRFLVAVNTAIAGSAEVQLLFCGLVVVVLVPHLNRHSSANIAVTLVLWRFLQLFDVAIKDRLFIYLIGELLLRLKCHSTEIFRVTAAICMTVEPVVIGFAAVAIVFAWYLQQVACGLVGRASANLILWAIIDLNLLIVREGVNLLNGKEILFVRCEFHIIVTHIVSS